MSLEAAGKDSVFKKWSRGARWADAVLAVIFFGLALRSGWWFWWASSAFCVLTAATGPVEKFFSFVLARFGSVKRAK